VLLKCHAVDRRSAEECSGCWLSAAETVEVYSWSVKPTSVAVQGAFSGEVEGYGEELGGSCFVEVQQF
jgi:hypothetical protein